MPGPHLNAKGLKLGTFALSCCENLKGKRLRKRSAILKTWK